MKLGINLDIFRDKKNSIKEAVSRAGGNPDKIKTGIPEIGAAMGFKEYSETDLDGNEIVHTVESQVSELLYDYTFVIFGSGDESVPLADLGKLMNRMPDWSVVLFIDEEQPFATMSMEWALSKIRLNPKSFNRITIMAGRFNDMNDHFDLVVSNDPSHLEEGFDGEGGDIFFGDAQRSAAKKYRRAKSMEEVFNLI